MDFWRKPIQIHWISTEGNVEQSLRNYTHQLQLGNMLLPRQRSRSRFLKCHKHIVTVHENVYKAIDQDQHGSDTARNKSGTQIARNDHDRMMVNVQEWNVSLLFAQHKENLYENESND